MSSLDAGYRLFAAMVLILTLVVSSKCAKVDCDVHCDPLNGWCDSPGKCNGTCIGGYGINAKTQTCDPCDANCEPDYSCNNAGPGTCEGDCVPGYGKLFKNNTCVQCIENCRSCGLRGPGRCDICKFGFGFDRQMICQPCDINCKDGCSNVGAGGCDGVCKPGFGRTQHFTCAPCDPHCSPSSACNNYGPGKCDGSCASGFGRTSTHNCDLCDFNCDPGSICDVHGAGTCDYACRQGYGLNDSFNCAPCDRHCDALGCFSYGSGKCDYGCRPGYHLTTDHTCQAITSTTTAEELPATQEFVDRGTADANRFDVVTIALIVIAAVAVSTVIVLAFCLMARRATQGEKSIVKSYRRQKDVVDDEDGY